MKTRHKKKETSSELKQNYELQLVVNVLHVQKHYLKRILFGLGQYGVHKLTFSTYAMLTLERFMYN